MVMLDPLVLLVLVALLGVQVMLDLLVPLVLLGVQVMLVLPDRKETLVSLV